ncbi:hypothetical protein [Poseidonibacter lekithochrous]|uniref:hypothetical protein n=1 Tax=Poseidonibacter lekithochrous TaxID=1904463 RepID=UPI0008FC94A1|nr:hypothetical protein [Poseidonibacter lekithochrous]QKJ21572.1 hypothetical protein ALEK_0252 [Poseidonibacter lekithochrous]
MNKFVKYGVAALLGLFVLTGCTTLAIQNVEKAPVISEKKLSATQVKNIIKKSGEKIGWRFKEIAPGKMMGIINVRNKHTAAIDIKYDKNSYSINYKKSTNLKYNAENQTIHKAYNSWITNLKNAIDFELSLI